MEMVEVQITGLCLKACKAEAQRSNQSEAQASPVVQAELISDEGVYKAPEGQSIAEAVDNK